MELYLDYNQYRSGEDAKEQYGDWYADNSYSDFEISLTGGNIAYGRSSRGNLTVAGEPKVGDLLYLVYALYSTGDSFGHENNCIEVIGAYDSQEKATQTVKTIQDDYKYNKEYDFDRKNKLVDGDGLPLNTNVWKGYFESLSSVEIELVEIQS